MQNLRLLKFKGSFAAFSGQTAQVFLTLAYVVVLARLLPPAVFGVFGLTWVWLGLLYLISDWGLSDHSLHTKTAQSHFKDYQLISFGVGILMTLTAIVLGLIISFAYQNPSIATTALALSPAFAFHAINHPYRSLLRERGDFKRLNIIQTLALALAVGLGITIALRIQNLTPLIVLYISREAAAWVLFACFSTNKNPDTFNLKRALTTIHRAKKASRNLIQFRLLNAITNHLDHIILGFVVSPATLGIYNRIQTLVEMPHRNLVTPLIQFGQPHLSKAKENAWSRESFNLIKLAAVLWIPFATLSLLNPHWVVSLALGDQWTDGAPWFRLLIIAFSGRLIIDLSNLSLVARGQTTYLSRWSILYFFVIAVLLIVNRHQGPNGIALHLAIGILLFTAQRLIASFRKNPQPWKALLIPSVKWLAAIAVFVGILQFTFSVEIDSLVVETFFIGLISLIFAGSLFALNAHNDFVLDQSHG